MGFRERAIGCGEAFQERLLVEFEKQIALFHLDAFDEEHLVHETLDAGADIDIPRRIKLPDQDGGKRHVGGGHLHDFDHRWRRRGGFGFLAGAEAES